MLGGFHLMFSLIPVILVTARRTTIPLPVQIGQVGDFITVNCCGFFHVISAFKNVMAAKVFNLNSYKNHGLARFPHRGFRDAGKVSLRGAASRTALWRILSLILGQWPHCGRHRRQQNVRRWYRLCTRSPAASKHAPALQFLPQDKPANVCDCQLWQRAIANSQDPSRLGKFLKLPDAAPCVLARVTMLFIVW